MKNKGKVKGLIDYIKFPSSYIEVFCSNVHCNRRIMIKKIEINGLVTCSFNCAKIVRDEMKER